jgi:hypothetical protein
MRKSAFSLVVILTVTIVIVNSFGTCYAQQSLPIGGKGIYLWQLWTANNGGKNLNTIIAKLKSTGISWIVIKMGDGDSFYNSSDKSLYTWATTNYGSMDSVISIFHSNGIKLLAFQYVYGVPHYWGNTWSETDVANWILDVKGIDGLMIDAEIEYDNLANRVGAARTYCDSIRAHHPNSFIGLTAWARPNSHPTFPWTTFLDRVAVNMPQAYWAARPTTVQNELNLMSSQFISNTNIWVSQGDSAAAKPIMPIGDAYDSAVMQGDITYFCSACQTTYNYPGVSLWEYTQVSYSFIWDEYTAGWHRYPFVLSTVPANNDTTTLISNSVTIQFSAVMDTQSVRGAFSIVPSVIGSLAWMNSNKTLTLTPSQSLSFNTAYTVKLDSTVRSASGPGLDQNNDGVYGDIYTFSFRTESALLSLKNPVIFPQVALNDSLVIQMGVRNRSANSITITSIFNKTGLFKSNQTVPVSISAGDSVLIPVLFKPQAYGSFSDTLFVNSAEGSISIPLNGSSPTPTLYVSRTLIGYGSRSVGSSIKGTFYITSLSINPVRVDSIKLRTKYFQISSFTMPQTLKLYDTLKIDLTFVPDSGRSYTDSVSIYNNSSTPIFRISLTGTGVGSSAVEPTNASVANTPVLSQNYPNPFNPTTTISFSLPVRAFVSLKIFNLVGREVAGLVNETKSPGAYSVQWNAAGCASGMYFYRLNSGSFTDTKKLLLIK